MSAPVVLITGGTGSFGRALTEYLLSLPNGPKVRVYSRDEHKQAEMARALPSSPRLTYILGDVCDAANVRRALDGATQVVHAAALKTVPAGETNAVEFTRVNIGGTQTVALEAIAAGVRRGLFISSDKAVESINHYGKTKAVSEGIWLQVNKLAANRLTRFAVVRGGNVWGSQGSIGALWPAAAARWETPTGTEPGVTRFHMLMGPWVRFAWWAANALHGGEIIVPTLPAWGLGALASAFAEVYGVEVDWRGSRAGDKRHEKLIATHESARTKVVDGAYIVEPVADMRAVLDWEAWPYLGVFPPGIDYGSNFVKQLSHAELTVLWNS